MVQMDQEGLLWMIQLWRKIEFWLSVVGVNELIHADIVMNNILNYAVSSQGFSSKNFMTVHI